jgi:hypothetical protein
LDAFKNWSSEGKCTPLRFMAVWSARMCVTGVSKNASALMLTLVASDDAYWRPMSIRLRRASRYVTTSVVTPTPMVQAQQMAAMTARRDGWQRQPLDILLRSVMLLAVKKEVHGRSRKMKKEDRGHKGEANQHANTVVVEGTC